MTAATAPPTPVSASSKIRIETGAERAASTAMASPMRESSPPEATRAMGRGVAPSCAAIWNSTASMPDGPGAAGVQAISSRVPGMPRRSICSVTSPARRAAVFLRAADTFSASLR